MRSQIRHWKFAYAVLAILVSVGAAGTSPAASTAARLFKSSEAAADALIAAAAGNDTEDLLLILGPEGKDVVFSGDPTADQAGRAAFVAAAKEKTSFFPRTKSSVFLEVGADTWPFPIPLVKGPKGWFFDSAAGREELISRRIGRNELNAIELCRGFVIAEKDYARQAPNGDGVYAQRLISTKGQRDGLYWPAKAGEPESPLGPLAADASSQGYDTEPSERGPRPFHGYLFKIMPAQGDSAPGGARSYIADGKMKGGFALVAWPAEYGVSGIMTFVVNQNGIVFEKDLGKATADRAPAMDRFDPDVTWKPTKS